MFKPKIQNVWQISKKMFRISAYLSEEFGSGSMVFFVVSFFALAASLIICVIIILGKCKFTAAMRLN